MLTYIYKLINKNQGSISISNFMNAALYHREHGYYMNKLSIGKDGDFITAPEISQLFGEIIAVWIMCMWKKLGKPSKFSLVELGPGKGTLVHDIIRVTKKYNNFFNSISINLVEISPFLQKVQKEKLKGLKGLDVNWYENIDRLPELPTIFLANEFFDALPIDQFVYYKGEYYENRIAKKNNSTSALFFSSDCPFFITQVARTRMRKELCIPILANKIKSRELFDGSVMEVCSTGIKILKKVEKKVYNNRGAALIIDYGYLHSVYVSTLQSVKQHKNANFLKNVGNSDITALVNFQALRNSLKYVDCEILTQKKFLYLFGIKERMLALIESASNKEKNRIFGEYLRLTENMGTLFKVMLIQYL